MCLENIMKYYRLICSFFLIIISITLNGEEITNPISGYCGKNGDNAEWCYTPNDSVLTISGQGEMKDYNGNCDWDKYPIKKVVINAGITRIGNYTFYSKKITSVEIPNTVTHIGSGAFAYCDSLSNVILPNSVTKIENNAFKNCTKLGKISINNVDTIGSCAFYKCEKLDIELPKSLIYIGERAFFSTKIKSISLNSNLRYVGFQAFSECHADEIYFNDVPEGAFFGEYCFQVNDFTEITIPNRISICFGMFNCCKKLKKLIFKGQGIYLNNQAFQYCTELEYIDTRELESLGVSAYEHGGPFTGCKKLGLFVFGKSIIHFPEDIEYDTYSIDEGIEYISPYAFNQFVKIKNIILPSTLLAVDARAFYEAENIETIDINKCDKVKFGIYAFYNSGIKKIIPFVNINSVDKGTFKGCKNIEKIELYEDEVDGPVINYEIPDYCFSDCTNLRSIKIPHSSSIGRESFTNCSSLKEINSGDISSFLDLSFSGCSSLDSLNFSNLSMTSRQFYINAFKGCSNLRVLVMPIFKPYIWNDDERDNIGVPSDIKIYIPGFRYNEYSQGMLGRFFYNANLISTWVDLAGTCGENGDNVKWSLNSKDCILHLAGNGRMIPISDINYNKYREAVKSCQFDENITNIADSLFYNTNLTSIEIGDNITEIGKYAFYNCKFGNNGFTLKIGKRVKIIGDYAFSNSGLYGIEFNEALDSIGARAFSETLISEIKIPNKISYMGNGVFMGCSSLQTIYFPTEFCRDNNINKNKIPNYFCYGCTSLNNIYIPCIEPPFVGNHSFAYLPYSVTIHIPYGSLLNYHNFIYNCNLNEYYCYVNCKKGGDGTGKIILKDGTEVENYEYYHLIGDPFYAKFIPDSSSVLSYIYVITNNTTTEEFTDNNINIDKLEGSKQIIPCFNLKSFILGINSNYGGKTLLLDNEISKSASFNVKYGDSIHIVVQPFEDYYIKEIKINDTTFKSEIDDCEEFDIIVDSDNVIDITYAKTSESGIDSVISNSSNNDIYTINGVKHHSKVSKDYLSTLKKGIYIIRSGNRIQKHIVK